MASDHVSETESNSESDIPRRSPAPGIDATIEQIREALKKEQLRNAKLESMYKLLKATNSGPTSRKKGRKSADELPAELVDNSDAIIHLGKKAVVMLCPWVPDSAFTQPRPTFDHLSVQWYANARNKGIGMISELYEFVPESLHEHLHKLPKFRDLFQSKASASRSSIIYNARSQANTIFKLDPKYFQGQHSLKDCDEILKLLGYKRTDNSYELFPPILFPDNVVNKREVFRNPALPLILKIALHGAGALNSVGKGKPKVNAQLWGVSSVNESAIAFAAIVGRYLLSKDTEFTETGNMTKINYGNDFWQYRKLLCMSQPSVRQDLIKFYNDVVFPSRSVPAAKEKSADDDGEDLTDLIAAFNLGSVSNVPTSDVDLPDSPVTPSTASSPVIAPAAPIVAPITSSIPPSTAITPAAPILVPNAISSPPSPPPQIVADIDRTEDLISELARDNLDHDHDHDHDQAEDHVDDGQKKKKKSKVSKKVKEVEPSRSGRLTRIHKRAVQSEEDEQ